MSIEELLKPRIICCEDYLNNKFEVGKPIPLIWKKEFNEWEYEDCSTEILLSTFLKYKQFRKLEWWEERKESEMPQYVKYNKTGRIFKVQYYKFIRSKTVYVEGLKSSLMITSFTPATEEEYIKYQQNKNVCQKKL